MAGVILSLVSVPFSEADVTNVTGEGCVPEIPSQQSSISTLAKPINYLQSSNSCNGILSKPEELQLVRSIDALNANYVAGKITLSERGKEAEGLVAKYSKGKGMNAEGYLRAAILSESKNSLDRYALLVGLNRSFGHPITDAQRKTLAKMGVPEDQVDAYVQKASQSYQGLMGSLRKEGIQFSSKGWDFTNAHLSVSDLNSNPRLKTAFLNFLPKQISETLMDSKRQTAVLFAK